MTRRQWAIIVVLAAGVFFVLCVFSFFVLMAIPSIKLPQVSMPNISTATSICDDPNYFTQTSAILDRWTDASTRASSTSRIALTSVVGEMQQIRRDYTNLLHPSCANRFHQFVTASMNDEIEGYLLFMQQASDSTVSNRMQLANDEMKQAIMEMQRIRGLTTATPNQAPAPPTANVTVTANEFKYNPTTVVVYTGQKVTITLKNIGVVQHTLVIPQLGIRLVANPGISATDSFTAGAIGTYSFYCEIPGHKEAGMTGQVLIR
jgi:plastocyanin